MLILSKTAGWLLLAYVLGVLIVWPFRAHGQAWVPPNCSGPNVALQYDQRGWVCATITGVQGPAGPPGPSVPAQPPPTECITSNWNGTAWVCVPTIYLEAR